MFDAKTTSHLPLDGLRTFLAAAEFRNFTRAGEEVHRSQSAVSMQMKRLETDLGKPLFERNGRSVTLTPDGEVLLGYARRMLALHDEALATLTAPDVTGEVRLGVPDDYATRYLPGVLTRFARMHPHVRIDVRCEPSHDLLAGFQRGELDMCLTTGDGATRVRDGGRILARIPLVWVMARGRDLAAIWTPGEPLPLAVFHEGCLHRRWALEALDKARIPWRIAFGSVSLAAILASVQSGLAVAPLAESSVADECSIIAPGSGLPELPGVAVEFHVQDTPGNKAAACLAQFVEECFSG